MVKITDVAEFAGVAKSTVSNVLTGRKYVSEELKHKVLAACKELDFEPNFCAAGLSSKKTGIIALLLEATQDIGSYPFYKDLILACLKEAAEKDYSLLVYYGDDNEKLLKTLRQGRAPIDGAILLAPSVDDERLAEMESKRTNCVVIGRPTIENISFVDVDNRGLVSEVAQKLMADYGKDIYLLNSKENLTISQDRTAGFKEALEKRAINPSGRTFVCAESSEQDGYNIAKDRIKQNAVFLTANEAVAMGVYRAVGEAGLKVGKDVAVFALGRSVEHGSFNPPLSYASQDYEAIGKRAVDLLLDEINGGRTETELLSSKIIYRESTQNR